MDKVRMLKEFAGKLYEGYNSWSREAKFLVIGTGAIALAVTNFYDPIMESRAKAMEEQKAEELLIAKEVHYPAGAYISISDIDGDGDADAMFKGLSRVARYVAPDMRNKMGRFYVDDMTEDWTPEEQAAATEHMKSGIALERKLGMRE